MNRTLLSRPIAVVALVLGSAIALRGGLAMTDDAPAAPTSFAPAPLAPLAAEPKARLVVDAPLPDHLAAGRVVVRYRAEHVRLLPVYGAAALNVSPRIGHLHVTMDDGPWRWVDASGEPLIINKLPPGRHKLLVELADPTHQVIDGVTLDFEVPKQLAPHH